MLMCLGAWWSNLYFLCFGLSGRHFFPTHVNLSCKIEYVMTSKTPNRPWKCLLFLSTPVPGLSRYSHSLLTGSSLLFSNPSSTEGAWLMLLWHKLVMLLPCWNSWVASLCTQDIEWESPEWPAWTDPCLLLSLILWQSSSYSPPSDHN